MNPDEKPTVTLDHREAHDLALWMVAEHLAYPEATGDWLEWEDVPYLDEASFEALQAAVLALAPMLRTLAGDEGRDLLDRATS